MSKGVIVVYHGIGSDNKFLEVDMDEFIKQIAYIKEKFMIVSLEQICNRKHSSKKRASIMFDDGYFSAYQGMQYLDSLNIKYSVAVIEEYLNKPGYCSLLDLQKLKLADFVYHTISHKKLTEITRKEQEAELQKGERSRKLQNIKPYLVYPFGCYDDQIINLAKEKRYTYCFSLLPFHIGKHFNRFKVPRLCMNGYVGYNKFKLLISSIGNIYLHLAFIKRKILKQSYLE